MVYNIIMINFLKKLLNIKDKIKKEFITVPTAKGPVNIETDDPIMAEVIAKAWDSGDIVVYENGQMKTITQNNKAKDN